VTPHYEEAENGVEMRTVLKAKALFAQKVAARP